MTPKIHSVRNRIARTATAAVLLLALAAPCALAARPEEDSTVRLAGLARAWAASEGEQRDRINAEAAEAAAARLAVFAALLETDPGSALRAVLPDVVRENLPAEAAAFVETPAEIEGELEVYYEDYEDHAVLRHFIRDRDGRRVSLRFGGEAPENLMSGLHVRANGVFFPGAKTEGEGSVDGALLLPDGQTLQYLYAGSATNPTPITADIANATGEQKTLVLLVNYTTSTEQPVTPAQMDSLVFGTINDFYLENSDNLLWLTGQTYGWFTVNPTTTCDTGYIASQADAAASAAGIDLTAYGHIVYYMIPTSGCTWNGMATMEGAPSRAWINGRFSEKTIGHELGHNFGLFHSHSLKCGSVPYGTGCTYYEYGDRFDVMGDPNTGHFNPFQKARLGWLSGAGHFTAVTGSAGQTYTLAAYEAAGLGLNALRIPAGTDTATGKPAWFFVEYRQPVGFDSFLTSYPGETVGVIVRRAVEGDPNSINLLYMQPTAAYTAALPVGATFQDPFSGAAITTLWADGVSAGVLVGTAAPVCTRAAPQVTVTPSPGPWSAPGTPVPFTVTVKNMDSSICSSSQFALTAAPPAGWATSFSGSGVSIAPGSSGTITLTVTSPTTAADGYYDIPFTAANATVSAPPASGTATYVVSAPVSDLAPVAVDDAASVAAGGSVTIYPLANDRDPEGKALTLVSVAAPSKGTITWNTGGTITYKAGRKSTGDDLFGYTVRDAAGNQASAAVRVTIAAATSKPGRK